MSGEKLQSVQPPVDAPQCGFEESVCTDKPEYHYDTENQICSPDVVVVVEYRETDKGIQEIIKLDEKKALANKAKPFKKEEDVENDPEYPTSSKKKSLSENIASAAAPQSAAVFVTPPESIQQIATVARADSIRLAPIDLGGLLCFDRDPSRQEAKYFVSDPDRITEGEPAFDISSLVPLSAVLFAQDSSLNLPAAMAVLMSSKSGEEFFVGSQPLPPIVPAESIPVVFKEGAAQHVAEKTAPRESDSSLPVSYSSSLVSYFDSSLPVVNVSHRISAADSPRQGGVFLFFATGGIGYDTVPALLILHPSIVNPRSVGGSGNAVFESGTRVSYAKINRGSDAQSSRGSSQQREKGDGGRRQQRG